MYSKLKDRGFDIIAVNAGDTVERVQRYLTEGKFTFNVVMGGRGQQYTLGRAYNVQAYPTNYLVGADGKILWRGVGFGPNTEAELLAALEKAGVK